MIFDRFRPAILFLSGLAATVLIAFTVGGCGPEYYKADADKEVYQIIDGKWKDSFGQKVNYKISDVPPCPNDIQVEKTIPSPNTINLAQAVAIATRYNRDYQSNKEALYLAALALTGERYKYALKWFGTIDATYARGIDSTTGNNYEDVSVNSEGGVKQSQLLGDGVLLNTGLTIDWVRFLTGDPRTTLGSILTGDIAIPLLGSGAGKAAKETLTQAERNVLYEIRSFNRYRQTFVVDIITSYYSVLQQRDSATNAWNNYKRSLEFTKQSEMEAKTGKRPAFEVDQAKQRELAAYDGYVGTEQNYEFALDSFKIRLSLPTDANIELDQNELKALQNIGVSEPEYTVDTVIETALLMRLDLANSADYIDDSVRNVILTSEGLGTQLNLTGSAAVNSTGQTDFDRLQFHKGNYNAGLSADLPFDRKNQRNAYRKAVIALEQSQRDYDNSIDTVILNVRQAYRQLKATAEQYITQKKSLTLAEERVRNMPLLLKSGRAVTRDLLDAQDALLLAQNDLTSALLGHTVAKLNFFRDVGVLQVRPDGMWEQNTQWTSVMK